MRFKKLELLGFKSFAEPTELTFEPGVTAVVGPNGCGKSNIADAIKWVLGEQSARELRGGKMEDLIFNGSDGREPIHYAEVALTLDNSEKKLPTDYTEVTIARRLFRSGESHYLLNGTIVRLKEISELLMGTGIGTSAYSLFEQGRIEQIINARPEERRVVFEEAAGITKFKSQKREAMRKLDETEENLARVGDVVAEVKRQIQALERQVRRAKVYQEQHEELKMLELKSARREMNRLSGCHRDKEDLLSQFRSQAAEMEALSQSWEERVRQARTQLSEAEGALSKARESLMILNHRQETIHGGLEMTRERMAEGQNRIADLRGEMAAAETQATQWEDQRKELASVMAREEQERRKSEEAISRSQLQLEECARLSEEAQKSLLQTQERILELTHDEVQVKNTLTRVRQESARLEARTHRLKTESAKVSSEQQEASIHLEGLEGTLQQAQTALREVERRQEICRGNLSTTESLLNFVGQEVRGLEQERTRLLSQWEALKDLVVAHEGYSSGVKALLTAIDSGRLERRGVLGVLAEILQVNREEMAAVDAALGSWAEAVVVQSGADAQRCRRFLEETKAGRVLFLLLDRVPAGESCSVPPPAAGIPLFDRVGITPHLSALLKFLLEETWLVENRQEAEAALHSSVPSGRRFVTSEGELFSRPSALLGPSPSEEGMIVGRMSRLVSMEVSLSHSESKVEEARGRQDSLENQKAEQAREAEALETNLRQRSQELHAAQAGASTAHSTLQKLLQEEDLLKVEESEASSELQEIHSQLDHWERKMVLREQEMESLQGLISQARDSMAQAGRTREEISVELATARTERASFDEVTRSRRASLHVLEGSLESAQAQRQARQEELGRLEARQIEWETACSQMEQQLSQLDTDLIQAQTAVGQAEKDRFDLLRAAEGQEKEFLVIRRRLEQIQSQLHTQEMEQAQVQFQSEQITSRLQQLYQLSLDESEEPMGSDPAGSDPMGPEAARARIEELSQKLQRMGPVNLGSIDEERELQNRFEYLTTQQNDLIRAKEDLHEALLKINRTTRAMFRETFQAIQKEFQVTYRQLFGGGEARLMLMDEEDLLESGVEIIARPPGKVLQPISLLSGGEKALTTIALLFAIFRIRPSPFCLLDEIDAPLDEINIDRFTRALREFLKDSQFIIITHNKKTMGMADVMYGITMQEMGVSKIVSVKFKQADGNGAAAPIPARTNGSS